MIYSSGRIETFEGLKMLESKIAKEEKILRTTFVRNATSVFKPMSFYLTKNN